MPLLVEVELAFSGNYADFNEIDLYDLSEALVGFQRSLALTTHLVLNGQVITHAPALQGAQIFALPPEAGSWKIKAAVFAGVMTGIYHFGTAPKDTPLGNLISSAYDYVISDALGFHVDYNKTLGQQYEELRHRQEIERMPQSKLDAVVEKCENAIKTMHRPISQSETAAQADISVRTRGPSRLIGQPLTIESYNYIAVTERDDSPQEFLGRVSSYNLNTYKGRVYIASEGRPIPFTLDEGARGQRSVARVVLSLELNVTNPRDPRAVVSLLAYRETSRSGRLKRLIVLRVSRSDRE
jgi:hypothetical protein